jgi:putative DNA primase/helicase
MGQEGRMNQAEDTAPAFSDDDLAGRFTARHSDDLRYVAAWGKWLQYDGTRWQFDSTLQAWDLTRIVCRDAASACNDNTAAKRIASATTIAAVERLARADRCHAAVVDQWDADPWLLNTPDGVVDLRNGRMRAHRREDFLTKQTAVAHGGGCPTWFAFLERVTDGDETLQSFLQRMAGYALTGSTKEHALFFLYGTGRNGKSVFTSALAGIVGDYGTTAPMEVFTITASDRHPTELAKLRGARLVTSIETEEGRRWNESRIKALTGGDRIAARFMRQDFFDFVPQFKLLIAGNHKPSLRNVDEAIRRRLHLIPFTVTIPAKDVDQDLSDKLKSEWPGILAWMVEGAVAWHEAGLAPPATVRDATDEYLAEEDAFSLWLDECTTKQSEMAFETTAELFNSWKLWADRTGEEPGSQRRFGQIMRTRGFTPGRQGGTGRKGFSGIHIKRPDYSNDERFG